MTDSGPVSLDRLLFLIDKNSMSKERGVYEDLA